MTQVNSDVVHSNVQGAPTFQLQNGTNDDNLRERLRPMSKCPLVSAIVPTHDRKHAASRCIESILRSNYNALEVIVIDDASTDGTSEDFRKQFNGITVLRNEREKFLASSRNTGCKRARGELILLIDDDNVVHPNAISELVRAFSDGPNVGIVGPVMYYLSDPSLVWYSGSSRSYLTSITRISKTIPKDGISEGYSTEDIPNAMMIRRQVFDKIGYFDEFAFPIHYDEADFCKRAIETGYQVLIAPRAIIWHDVPVRRKHVSSVRDLHMTNPMRTYYVARNRIVFMKKHASWWKLCIFSLVFFPAISIVQFFVIVNSADRRQLGATLRAYAGGVIDGLDF